MGWHGAKLGGYKLFMHDSIHNEVKRARPLEYYEKYKVDLELFYPDETEEKIKLPLSRFGKPQIIKKMYEFIWDIDMTKLLFQELKKRKIILKGKCILYALTIRDPNKYINYYLDSEIGDNNITLKTGSSDVIHELKTLRDLR